MKKILGFLSAALIIVSCKKEATNETTVIAEAEILAKKKQDEPQQTNFNEPNLFPEGVVYDEFNNRFYVSSTTRGDIGIVTADGSYHVFIDDAALTSTTGLEISTSKKLLYVANAPGSVGIYRLNDGSRVALIDLAAVLPGRPIFVNDIALDAQGNAYVTNSLSPVIYKITPEGTATVFFQNQAFATAPGGFGFNGIEYGNSQGGYLLVAHTATNSVVKIPVDNSSAYSTVLLDAPLNRPDGLLLSNNGKQLIVVNNAGGTADGKVISFASDDKWLSAVATTTFNTGAVFPTTATSNGKNVFVLYAYLHRRATGQSTYTIQQVPLNNAGTF
ncbi:MAG: SMP-30/gluconolactonase/LRE family protein [Bacteroidota bacterium]